VLYIPNALDKAIPSVRSSIDSTLKSRGNVFSYQIVSIVYQRERSIRGLVLTHCMRAACAAGPSGAAFEGRLGDSIRESSYFSNQGLMFFFSRLFPILREFEPNSSLLMHS
jgi:hypothetical protein